MDNDDQLVLTRQSTWSSGTSHEINISAPLDLENLYYPFILFGSVTVGSLENTHVYAIYNQENMLVFEGFRMTDSPDIGQPGNFSLLVNQSASDVYDKIRIYISEINMTDGSPLTLDSVLVNDNTRFIGNR